MDRGDYLERRGTVQRLRNELREARLKLSGQKDTLLALCMATDRAMRAYRKVAGDMHRLDGALDAAMRGAREALAKEDKVRATVAKNERALRLAEGHVRKVDTLFMLDSADVEGERET